MLQDGGGARRVSVPARPHLSKKEQAKADARRKQLQSAIEKSERVIQDQRNRLANLDRKLQHDQQRVSQAQRTAVETLLAEKERTLARLHSQLCRDFPDAAEA